MVRVAPFFDSRCSSIQFTGDDGDGPLMEWTESAAERFRKWYAKLGRLEDGSPWRTEVHHYSGVYKGEPRGQEAEAFL